MMLGKGIEIGSIWHDKDRVWNGGNDIDFFYIILSCDENVYRTAQTWKLNDGSLKGFYVEDKFEEADILKMYEVGTITSLITV